jgi:hypothetical protein
MKQYRKHKTLTLLLSVTILIIVSVKISESILYIIPDAKPAHIHIFEVCFGSLLMFSSMYFLFLRPLVHEVETRVNANTTLGKAMKRADKMMYRNKSEKKQGVVNLSSQLFSGTTLGGISGNKL